MRAPGPTTWQFVRGVRRHGFLDYVGQLWREHGDTIEVRLGTRRMMIVVHPDAVERIAISGRAKYDKTVSIEAARKYLTGDGLVSSTGALWRRQRRSLAPFFTPKAIRGFAGLIIEDGERMRERWRTLAREGNEVEIAEEMTSVTASIILKSMFSSDSIDGIDQMRWAIETMLSFVSLRATGIALPLWLPTRTNRGYVKARRMVHRAIGKLIARRRALPTDAWPDDLLSRLLSLRDEAGAALPDSLVRDEAITTFFAGHETTARTMTFAWYALATHPHAAERLHEELDRVLGGRAPTLDDLRALPYTLQVVKEVLRLHPPAPFYSRDAVEPDQLGGYDVGRGTIMLLAPYYSHRHPDFWEDPMRFDPDRWTREPETSNKAFHPFGAGPRVCIGNHFSLLESQLLLAILAQHFTTQLRPGYVTRWEMKGVLGLAHGLPMRIVMREAASSGLRRETAQG